MHFFCFFISTYITFSYVEVFELGLVGQLTVPVFNLWFAICSIKNCFEINFYFCSKI